MTRRWLKVVGIVAAGVALLALVAALLARRAVVGSLPVLEGEVEVAGLEAPVTIIRDALGVPTIRGRNRSDVARALGFVHGQERFFQMDLLRRRGAGELAELFGPAALEADRGARLHGFRNLARLAVEDLPDDHRRLLAAYTAGVNAGLAALAEPPFEYLVLRLDPEPWREEDSVLVVHAMYFTLNDAAAGGESARGLVHDLLGDELAAFLLPAGTSWDAPVAGAPFATQPIPGPAALTADVLGAVALDNHRGRARDGAATAVGSNNWAVAGSKTADGRAILANDMHLPLSLPNTWYRARLEWPGSNGADDPHQVTGVTLPGSPAVVVGSNSRVAWGFTNSYGDWSDLVILEVDGDRYLTPGGEREFETRDEVIEVRGAEADAFAVRSTVWGPVIDEDHLGRPRALRWIAHDPAAVNLGLLDLEQVSTVDEALAVANRTGIPPQNFVCADRDGRIGWTIIGRIPVRAGFTGEVPTSWADGTRSWTGWLQSEAYPRIVDPPGGLIWTANARVVSGEMLAIIGDGGYDLGARAGQIRDDLLAVAQPDEGDMLAIQLDDRALFLERWRRLVLDLLDAEAVSGHPGRAIFRDLVADTWTGRASVDSQAYRLVRTFRFNAFELVYGGLTARCEQADDRFDISRLTQWEDPLWLLSTERPAHFLGPDQGSWREALLSVVDATVSWFETEVDPAPGNWTWGQRNSVSIRHPLSRAIPQLAGWLDLPRQPLPGDSNMPRVQGPTFGASERLAVSPGHEEDGYYHMPGGQSGHPLSPSYRAGHEAWLEGRRTPFLPGEVSTVLTLRPAAG